MARVRKKQTFAFALKIKNKWSHFSKDLKVLIATGNTLKAKRWNIYVAFSLDTTSLPLSMPSLLMFPLDRSWFCRLSISVFLEARSCWSSVISVCKKGTLLVLTRCVMCSTCVRRGASLLHEGADTGVVVETQETSRLWCGCGASRNVRTHLTRRWRSTWHRMERWMERRRTHFVLEKAFDLLSMDRRFESRRCHNHLWLGA